MRVAWSGGERAAGDLVRPETEVVRIVTSAGPADRGQSARPPERLQAEVGDALIIEPDGSPAGAPRVGEIIEVHSPDGSPPYVVRWLAGEYDSTITPGSRAHIEKRHRAGQPRRPRGH
jgi:Domain of unknown function (DUF1918)